ncbi:oxidoreductase-like domain-containing protein 1 [Dinothrombium tinctorium]|uniref:Oxidoreductase-like domain-containing protein 1 n=1 Tax=Dinothrombium tinctorium TaxID=1965070 RepID=A0A443QJ73_9ACAR|nr:oxidoreductase-like domain-containing protein 1 [Dinothrombium tinctorium]
MYCLKYGRHILRLTSYLRVKVKKFCDKSVQQEIIGEKQPKLPEPPDPDMCCMSGCVNCVYVKYAMELYDIVENGNEVALKMIEEHVKDESLKTFIKMQIKEKEELKNKK